MAKFTKAVRSDFTIVHNTFIRDTRLNYTDKGLLLDMLQKPDGWSFSIKGLAANSRDGERKITRALHELEDCGYVVRRIIKDENGRFVDWEYIISDEVLPDEIRAQSYKLTQKPKRSKSADLEENTNIPSENLSNEIDCNDSDVSGHAIATDANSGNYPHRHFADVAVPDVDNSSAYKELKYQELKYQVCQSSNDTENKGRTDGLDNSALPVCDAFDKDELISTNPDKAEQITFAYTLMFEVFHSKKKTIRISGESIPMREAVSRLSQITPDMLLWVVENTEQYSKRNPRAYMLTALFNAPIDYACKQPKIKHTDYSFDLDAYKSLANNFSDIN